MAESGFSRFYHHGSADVQSNFEAYTCTLQGYDCRVSDDGGHYLCEHLLYASLAYFHHDTRNYALPWHQKTAPILMQLPDKSDNSSVEAGRDVAIALIYALTDSRRSRAGDYETERDM